jgi:hypothetical protein
LPSHLVSKRMVDWSSPQASFLNTPPPVPPVLQVCPNHGTFPAEISTPTTTTPSKAPEPRVPRRPSRPSLPTLDTSGMAPRPALHPPLPGLPLVMVLCFMFQSLTSSYSCAAGVAADPELASTPPRKPPIPARPSGSLHSRTRSVDFYQQSASAADDGYVGLTWEAGSRLHSSMFRVFHLRFIVA